MSTHVLPRLRRARRRDREGGETSENESDRMRAPERKCESVCDAWIEAKLYRALGARRRLDWMSFNSTCIVTKYTRA
jgi:hypothetical protein